MSDSSKKEVNDLTQSSAQVGSGSQKHGGNVLTQSEVNNCI